jgi:hypothetical protein
MTEPMTDERLAEIEGWLVPQPITHVSEMNIRTVASLVKALQALVVEVKRQKEDNKYLGRSITHCAQLIALRDELTERAEAAEAKLKAITDARDGT